MVKYYRRRRAPARYKRKRSAYKKRTGYRAKRTFRRPMYKRKVNAYKLRRQFMPLCNIVKMKYVTSFTVTTIANAAAFWKFRANSLYDPDETGSGHQPSNYDLWALQYKEYNVIGSKITVKYLRTNALVSEGIFTVKLMEETSTVADTYSEILEFNSTKNVKICGGWIDDYKRSNVAVACYGANKWWKRKVLSDADMWTEFGNNPGTANTATFWVSVAKAFTGNVDYSFEVQVEYCVALRGRLQKEDES